MQAHSAVAVHVTVSMNLPGPYPMYSCEQFPINPSPICKVKCNEPTNIIFTLDDATLDAGWRFAGYAPRASLPMPLHINQGFSSAYPNHSVTVFNPAQRKGDTHFFSLFYNNPEYNKGAPFSFDPETQNE
jgi:hypothetical protein